MLLWCELRAFLRKTIGRRWETPVTEWERLFAGIQEEVESISTIRIKESLRESAIALGWLHVMENARTAAGLFGAELEASGGAVLRAGIELSFKVKRGSRAPDAQSVLKVIGAQLERKERREARPHAISLMREGIAGGRRVPLVRDGDVQQLYDDFLNAVSHANLDHFLKSQKPPDRNYLATKPWRMDKKLQRSAVPVVGGLFWTACKGLKQIRETSNELGRRASVPVTFNDDNTEPLRRRGRQTAELAGTTAEFLRSLIRRRAATHGEDEALDWLGAYALLATDYARAIGHCADNCQWRSLYILARPLLDSVGRMALIADGIRRGMPERIKDLNRDGKCQQLGEKLEEGALTPAGVDQARSLHGDLDCMYAELNRVLHYQDRIVIGEFKKMIRQKGVTSQLKLPCDVQLGGKVDQLARSALSNAAVLLAHHAVNESAVVHARDLIPGQHHHAVKRHPELTPRRHRKLTPEETAYVVEPGRCDAPSVS